MVGRAGITGSKGNVAMMFGCPSKPAIPVVTFLTPLAASPGPPITVNACMQCLGLWQPPRTLSSDTGSQQHEEGWARTELAQLHVRQALRT